MALHSPFVRHIIGALRRRCQAREFGLLRLGRRRVARGCLGAALLLRACRSSCAPSSSLTTTNASSCVCAASRSSWKSCRPAIAGAASNSAHSTATKRPCGSMNHGGHRTISVTSMMDDRTQTLFAALDDQQEAMTTMLARPRRHSDRESSWRRRTSLAWPRSRQAMRTVGLTPERVDILAASVRAAPRAALRAYVGDSGPTLYFHGHYDVVPAFSRDQFVPRVEGDTLFGRGSSDMKSGLVAILFAARALQSIGVPMRGRLAVLFVPDEETGGAGGSGALAASGELARDGIGMLLPEPTSGRIWHSSRGAFTAEVVVRGRAAHVGMQQSRSERRRTRHADSRAAVHVEARARRARFDPPRWWTSGRRVELQRRAGRLSV